MATDSILTNATDEQLGLAVQTNLFALVPHDDHPTEQPDRGKRKVVAPPRFADQPDVGCFFLNAKVFEKMNCKIDFPRINDTQLSTGENCHE